MSPPSVADVHHDRIRAAAPAGFGRCLRAAGSGQGRARRRPDGGGGQAGHASRGGPLQHRAPGQAGSRLGGGGTAPGRRTLCILTGHDDPFGGDRHIRCRGRRWLRTVSAKMRSNTHETSWIAGWILSRRARLAPDGKTTTQGFPRTQVLITVPGACRICLSPHPPLSYQPRVCFAADERPDGSLIAVTRVLRRGPGRGWVAGEEKFGNFPALTQTVRQRADRQPGPGRRPRPKVPPRPDLGICTIVPVMQ
jgi:hypothetical protein